MSDSKGESSNTSSSESLKKRQKMEGDKENLDAMEIAPGGGLDATSLARFSRQNAALGELNRSGALRASLVQHDKFLVLTRNIPHIPNSHRCRDHGEADQNESSYCRLPRSWH